MRSSFKLSIFIIIWLWLRRFRGSFSDGLSTICFLHSVSLSVLPFACLNGAVSRAFFTLAMLHSFEPSTLKVSSIWPSIFPVSFLFVIFIRSYEYSAIRPREFTFAVHFVILPFSFVISSICPDINSVAMNVVVHVVSIKGATVRELELSLSIFLSVLESSVIE
jgi:4-amino-4-deoxy-L-arabinose transferase-like glycosyltransferase